MTNTDQQQGSHQMSFTLNFLFLVEEVTRHPFVPAMPRNLCERSTDTCKQFQAILMATTAVDAKRLQPARLTRGQFVATHCKNVCRG